jgi:integrator complex subunit 7
VISSLAYPNLLGNKRLGCCCCRKTCPSTVASTVFSRLLPLVNDEGFQLHCKGNALRILQMVMTNDFYTCHLSPFSSFLLSDWEKYYQILCGKTPSIHDQNGSELSKLLLAAKSSLHSSSWEMRSTAIEILVEIICFLKQRRSDLTINILKGSLFSYTECQGITNRMSLTSEENCNDRHQYKIIAMIVNHCISCHSSNQQGKQERQQ